MPHAIAGDTPRHDPPAFGQKIPQQPHILEIEGDLFIAESADTSSLK
jgi:hypothetical protein